MRPETSQTLTIQTRTGQALFGDNVYFGHVVGRSLAGSDRFWSVVSLSLGGPRLSTADCAVLDDLAVCESAADPRVWPLKMARLVSSWGARHAGLATALVCAEGAAVGPGISQPAAELLVELRDLLEAGTSLDAVVDGWRAARRRLAGFGVPLRDRDERVVALARCLEMRQREGTWSPGPWWRLAQALEQSLLRGRPLRMNAGAAAAALCLDMGFEPRQIGLLNTLLCLHNYLAHSVEGAEQQHPVARQLPASSVRYEGAAPRTSPRAVAATDT